MQRLHQLNIYQDTVDSIYSSGCILNGSKIDPKNFFKSVKVELLPQAFAAHRAGCRTNQPLTYTGKGDTDTALTLLGAPGQLLAQAKLAEPRRTLSADHVFHSFGTAMARREHSTSNRNNVAPGSIHLDLEYFQSNLHLITG